MRRVAVAACGMAGFSMDDAPVESVLAESARDLLGSCGGAGRDAVDSVVVSTNSDSKYLSQILSEKLGIRPRMAHSVESMCSSGTSALVSAYSHVASGLADVALVSGADRHDCPGRVLDWDDSRGEFRHPVYWASIFTSAYKRRHSVTDEDLAMVPVKNRRQAADNPHALPGRPCTAGDVLGSRRLTDDVRLLDCSRPCTGGASVLLASEERAGEITDVPVWVTGIGQKTTSAAFAGSAAFDSIESAGIAARDALRMSGRAPGDVGVAEVHDAFSVCEPMALESMGLAGEGRGAALARELYETGDRRINPRGGLIGSGHPLGATGIAQAVEVARQLRGEAGRRQVDGPRVGLVHNMAAAATSSTVLVLER